MVTEVLIDCELTSLLNPEVLSVGLVTLDGRECYAELNLESHVGRARLAETPWEVRAGVIQDKWGLFPEAVCNSDRTIGRRVGEWLLGVAESDADGRIRLLYDYSVDIELLTGALEECDLCSRVHRLADHLNIAGEAAGIGPELASEATFRALRRRQPPLYRHHALADALALRAAWRTWHLVQERASDFARLLKAASAQKEGWLYEWLATPYIGLDHQAPLDVLDQAGGLELVEDALVRWSHNVF
jgi:hypothetical protein